MAPPVTCTVGSHLVFDGLPAPVVEALKKKLSFSNPAYSSACRFSTMPKHIIEETIPKRIEMYHELEDGTLAIPRGFDWRMLKSVDLSFLNSVDWRDERIEAPVSFPPLSSSYKLVPWQRDTVAAISSDAASETAERPFGTYLVIKGVAGGKTLGQAAVAAALGQRTLVLVHLKEIERAWRKDLEKFYGLAGDAVGEIRGKKVRIGEQFTIASVQTFFRREHNWAELFKLFGTVILDECHRCPARTFYDCIANIPTKYRIGMTGTEERKDGLHKMMYRLFGTAFIHDPDTGQETETSLPVSDVKTIRTALTLPEKRFRAIKKDKKWVTVEVDVDPTDPVYANTWLGANLDFDEIVLEPFIAEIRAGNCCLLVSSRVDQLQRLYDKVQQRTKWKGCLLLGDTPEKVRAENDSLLNRRMARYLVASLQCFVEGANVKPLNRIFLAGSFGDPAAVQQVIGRVRRKHTGKKDVIVYDFYHPLIPCLQKQYHKRVDVYRTIGVPRFKSVFMA